MTRRWHADETSIVSGVRFLTRQGAKAPGDLRLDVFVDGRWLPVKMEMAFFLVDFFAENEDHLRHYRPGWRQNGQRYFLNACISAVRAGWRTGASEIERQRARQ